MIRNEVIDSILNRRSIREFTDELVKREELETIVEAGKYAASGGGRQPGLMVVTQNPELISKLEKLNAKYTKNPKGRPFYGANTLIMVFADSNSSTWMQDGSLVLGNLMEAAHAIGVGSCWINRCFEMFEDEEGIELKKQWGIGESFKGVGNCILGYIAGDYPVPKARKDDFVIYLDD